MLMGYARVSTDDQNLHLQIDALQGTGVEEQHIYREKISGKNMDRPELENCLKALREGDTLVVWKLDRLGRSLPDLVKIVNDLSAKGIGFRSLKDGIDTGDHNALGKFLFNFFAVLAEFERDIIRERTKAGLQAARARGRKGGRQKALTPEKVKTMMRLYDAQDLPVRDICKLYGIGRTAFYRYRKTAQSGNVTQLSTGRK